MSDPKCTKYLSFSDERKSEQGAKDLLAYTVGSYQTENPLFILAAEDNESNYLGTCGLNPLDTERQIEIFYTVNSEHQRKGFALKMVNGLIEYLKTNTEYQLVVAYIVPENSAAIIVANKAGFNSFPNLIRPPRNLQHTAGIKPWQPGKGGEIRRLHTTVP